MANVIYIHTVPAIEAETEMPAIDRTLIAKLARASKSGVITLFDASKELGLDSKTTAGKLGSLTRRGWTRGY